MFKHIHMYIEGIYIYPSVRPSVHPSIHPHIHTYVHAHTIVITINLGGTFNLRPEDGVPQEFSLSASAYRSWGGSHCCCYVFNLAAV